MSAAKRPPRVVAELGRPETPEETAERKARDSALYRQRKTVNNLVLSLIVSLAMVVVIVLAVPRGNYDSTRSVDVVEIAEAAQPVVDMPLAVPDLSEGWRSTKAEIRESAQEGITFWYVGYLTPDDQFAAFKQALGANPSWIAKQLEDRSPTGTETRNGVVWTVYDYQELSADTTNVRLGLTTVAGEITYVVYGTATLENMWVLADEIANHIRETNSESSLSNQENADG
jgi:hypothetical protein